MADQSATTSTPADDSIAAPPTYVVVGAGPGIGLETAKAFAAKGWRTVLVGRTLANLEKLAAAIAEEFPDAPPSEVVVADAEEPVALKLALDDADLGRVDVAHFNVVLWVPGGYESSLIEVAAGMSAGVVSAMAMAQSLVPLLVEAPGRGLVMLTGGGTADHPAPASTGLGLQKAALRNLALALHQELDPERVRVSTVTIYGTVAPGTDFAANRIGAAIAGIYDSAQSIASSAWSAVTEFRS
ncbi:MAG: SDR family NAD(P)-dependent oxidoreductase [Candidatus Nanopelagicales bacterium]